MQQCTRAVGVAARLLLVVVLALGVFIMHTVGHPGDGSATGTASPSHMTSMVGMPAHGHEHGADVVPDTGPPPAPRAADAAAGPEQAFGPAPADVPGTAMDMASLCLAVLGSWALAGLLHAVFVGRRDLFARLATRVLAAARPDPPRAPDLAQLSILRI
ncbi:hypothetical protein [Streptomyces marianii]|uniref:hypothetical protein n=1 Tax=Streptomyces marianii TaxID=1817406 RepID=UPI001F33741F|nr:hypothetical protein [Streptomyces marianii]